MKFIHASFLLVALVSILPLAAAEYHVGPGMPLANIHDVPGGMHNLTAGDTVYIHWRATPYREKFRLSGVGTAAMPIRVIGVPGPGGERPVLHAQNATSHPGDVWGTYGNNISNADLGMIIIYRGPGSAYEAKPEHIIVEGLEITGCRKDVPFTTAEGNPRTFGGSGIWMRGPNDVSLINVKIHDCTDGLFASSGGDEPNTTRRLLVKKCHIENCSENMQEMGLQFGVHNIYTECAGVTFEENYFGPTRPNSDGGNLKDRSSDCVIRYNHIEGGLRLLDLVEAQDSWPMVQADLAGGNPAYRTTQVYGNYFHSGANQAIRAIHYGGDSGDVASYRKGTLYFHHNTVVFQRDRSEAYRHSYFELATDDETVEAWNNVFHSEAATPGADASLHYLVNRFGNHNFGPNWVTSGWDDWDNGLPPEAAGTVNGVANLVSGTSPGFVNIAAKDFRLGAYSTLRNIGGALLPAASPVTLQYVAHRQSQARPVAGLPDMGANEFLPPAGPVAPVAFPQTLNATQNTPRVITLAGYDDNGDALTFAVATQPANGVISGTEPNITYTPNANFIGTDSFTFTSNDGALTSAPATISLNVTLPRYTLTVQNGSGDGDYLAGEVVTITADAAPSGQQFVTWAGATVATPLTTTTTITIPAAATTVAALFRATPPPGGPFTYNVGPGQTYTSLAQVPWTALFPGDTVRLHWRATPYAEKVLIPARGTAAAPIRFTGVPGPAGQRPVISGLNATLAPDSGFASWDISHQLGLITIARAETDSQFFKPGFIEIRGLELREIAATPDVWFEGAAAIRLDAAESVTVRDCDIHTTCTGLIARMNGSTEFGLSRDLAILNTHFHNTGTVGQYSNANLNTEVAGITVRGCRFDPPIAGSFGDNILDRSAGTVFESCRIEGAARVLELAGISGPNAQIIRDDPRFTTTRVAGCLIISTDNQAGQPVFVGADPNYLAGTRTGIFEMLHNTVIIASGTYQVNVPSVYPNITVDFRHNIIRRTGTEIIQLMSNGTLNSGVNWISPGWQPGPAATLNGTAAILTNVGNDPQLDANYAPLPASQCRDAASALLVPTQFAPPPRAQIRLTVGPAPDLGAFEGGLSAPGAVNSLTPTMQPGGLRLTLNATPLAPYEFEYSNDLITWQPFGTAMTNASGILEVLDAAALNEQRRFYRVQPGADSE